MKKDNVSDSQKQLKAADNLTISNSIKGILHMSCENGELRVVENQWKKVVQRFPGALAVAKFGR